MRSVNDGSDPNEHGEAVPSTRAGGAGYSGASLRSEIKEVRPRTIKADHGCVHGETYLSEAGGLASDR